MIKCSEFTKSLKKNNVSFYCGVPDSLLKDICAYIQDNVPKERNIITANEGNAVALAAGHYLGTGESALVYMQNSGLGNTINPLASLVDKEVYSIPVLLLIGWRGEPGVKDEPQHIKQGKVTTSLLEVMGIPYKVISSETEDIDSVVEEAAAYMKKEHSPYAIIVKKGTFEPYKLQSEKHCEYEMKREEAIDEIIKSISGNSMIISTTGKASRELFELREAYNKGHENDFLTVGSMGHSSSITLGVALSNSERNIYCLDGDGALIMHMGALGIIGNLKPKNFKHIVINNGAHDSVGGQPTVGYEINITQIAKACGYKNAVTVKSKNDLIKELKLLKTMEGPALIEVRVSKGARKDLGRPTKTPTENKQAFMEELKQ